MVFYEYDYGSAVNAPGINLNNIKIRYDLLIMSCAHWLNQFQIKFGKLNSKEDKLLNENTLLIGRIC